MLPSTSDCGCRCPESSKTTVLQHLIAIRFAGSTTIAITNLELIANIPSGNQSPHGQTLPQLLQSSFQRGAPPRQCQPFLTFRPRFPFAAADHWFASKKTINRRLHALRGNHWCRLCNCSLVDRTFSYCPEIFRTIPICLMNGMAVHKEHFCSADLSLWYYRRGVRHYAVEAKPATFINISVLREPPAACRGATASPNTYYVTS